MNFIMKNSIKHFLLPLVCGIAFISCEKQTTPEPVQIQRPELQSPIVRDDVYYARLRAYKKTDHKAGLVLGQLSILLNKVACAVPPTRWILFRYGVSGTV